MMTYTGHSPHIVLCPDDFLTQLVKLADTSHAQEPLIDPVKAHDIGFLHPRMMMDI